MLTKNLLKNRIYKGKIKPFFLKVTDSETLELAEALLSIFADGQGKSQGDLTELVASVSEGNKNPLVVKGLEKLLFDRSDFEAEGGAELSEMRSKLLMRTSDLLKSPHFGSFSEYQEIVSREFNKNFEQISAELYSDLPMFNRLKTFSSLSSEALVHRYNCAQIQGLLLNADYLKVKLPRENLADVRFLFRRLKFFQLLAKVKKTEDGDFEISIDGPLALFQQSQKYGMNIANFFPAILNLKTWSLISEVQVARHNRIPLELDHTCGVRSHYTNASSYLPKELAAFGDAFKEKVSEWTLAEAEDFLQLVGEGTCFPDYTLQHLSGRKVSLELFHLWHRGPLSARLKQLSSVASDTPPLLIGVSRQLAKEPQIAEIIEESEYFKKFGFLFREMPTIAQVSSVLKNVLLS